MTLKTLVVLKGTSDEMRPAIHGVNQQLHVIARGLAPLNMGLMYIVEDDQDKIDTVIKNNPNIIDFE